MPTATGATSSSDEPSFSYAWHTVSVVIAEVDGLAASLAEFSATLSFADHRCCWPSSSVVLHRS